MMRAVGRIVRIAFSKSSVRSKREPNCGPNTASAAAAAPAVVAAVVVGAISDKRGVNPCCHQKYGRLMVSEASIGLLEGVPLIWSLR